MADNDYGAKLSIDITDLKAGLAQANRLIRESESQFREAAAGMDDWKNSSEGLEARMNSLNAQVDIQRQKVKALIQQKESIIKTMQEEGKSQEEIERAIDKVNGQIAKESKQLDRLQSAADKSEKALDDFKNASDDAGESADDAADDVKDLDGSFEGLESAGKIAVTAIAAVATACAGAVTAFLSLAESTREYREDLAKLESAFETAGHTTEEATAVYKELYSVFGEEDRAVEAAQQIAKLADNEEEMARMTEIATGAWAMWGDSLATESLMEGINHTAKLGEVQGTLADALEWCGINVDDYNEKLGELTTEEERSSFILDTLNGLYDDAAEKYRENSASIIDARKATSDYNDALAELGERAEPITTKLTEGFTRVLEAVIALVDDSGLEDIGDIIDDAFDTFIDDIIPAVVEGFEWIVEHGENIVDVLKAIGIGFAAMKVTGIITSLVSSFKGLVSALKGAKGAQDGLNASMAANVVGAVVTAVVLLVDGLRDFAKAADDAVNGWSGINSATEANVEANARWQESMDEARATLGDYSGMLSAAGNSASDLEADMKAAQDGITGIFREAYKENRKLREEEIESVRQFNQDYIAAQQELAELQGLILKAQTDSLQWQLENLDLSETEISGILNTLQEKRGEYLNYMDQSVAEEIALYDMQYQQGALTEQEWTTQREGALAKQREYRETSKTIQEQATQDALDHLAKTFEIDAEYFASKEKAFQSVEQLQQHYVDKMAEINANEELNWFEKQLALQQIQNEMTFNTGAFLSGQEVMYQDFAFLTDQAISQNVQAFFNWIGETAAAGQKLSEENKELAKNIIAAYDDLPEELQEAGLESLRALAAGMAEEYPSLEGYATMSMDELIAAMDAALGNASPSKKTRASGANVVKGLALGMKDAEGEATSTASTIADKVVGFFSGALESISGIIGNISSRVSAAMSGSKAGNAAAGGTAGAAGTVVVNQTNNYSQSHSRAEIYNSNRAITSAVKKGMKQ